jgi:hypothetical protein
MYTVSTTRSKDGDRDVTRYGSSLYPSPLLEEEIVVDVILGEKFEKGGEKRGVNVKDKGR